MLIVWSSSGGSSISSDEISSDEISAEAADPPRTEPPAAGVDTPPPPPPPSATSVRASHEVRLCADAASVRMDHVALPIAMGEREKNYGGVRDIKEWGACVTVWVQNGWSFFFE